MAPPKRAKFTKMDTVFTEGSMECLSKRLVVDFDGEIAAQETIDACVHLAFAHVKSRIQEEMAVSFAVVSLARTCWDVMAMVPPLLSADILAPLGRAGEEPDPGAIDSWASFYLSLSLPRVRSATDDSGHVFSHELEHRGALLNATGTLGNPPRVLAAPLETDGNGRRALSRPTSAGSVRRPSSANRRPASASRARHDLFKLADSANNGTISAEEMHEWLNMQSPMPFSEVKKVLDAVNQPHSQPFGPGIFADILGLLQKANPKRWAMESLTVFAIPKPRADPQLSMDARELKEILNPTPVAKPKLEELTSFCTTDNALGDTPTFGTSHIIDDRVQPVPLVPQTFVSNVPRMWTAANKIASTRSLKSTRRLQSAYAHSKQPSITLMHSSSQPALGRTQVTKQPALGSLNFLPLHFRQTSLVKNFEFVPEAGVSAIESCVSRSTDTNNDSRTSREGPPWPSDPNHMTRSTFDSLKTPKRPESVPRDTNASGVKSKGTKGGDLLLSPNASEQNARNERIAPRRIGGPPGSGGIGSIITSPLFASAFLELPSTGVDPLAPEPLHLVGGRLHPDNEACSEIPGGSSQERMQLEEAEAKFIHELRGEDAVGRDAPNIQLPAYSADVRTLQRTSVLEGRSVSVRERTHNHATRFPLALER